MLILSIPRLLVTNFIETKMSLNCVHLMTQTRPSTGCRCQHGPSFPKPRSSHHFAAACFTRVARWGWVISRRSSVVSQSGHYVKKCLVRGAAGDSCGVIILAVGVW